MQPQSTTAYRTVSFKIRDRRLVVILNVQESCEQMDRQQGSVPVSQKVWEHYTQSPIVFQQQNVFTLAIVQVLISEKSGTSL